MYYDSDIKIAGNKPSQSIKSDISSESMTTDEIGIAQTKVEQARKLGVALAEDINRQQNNFSFGLEESEDEDIMLQRRILLSFAVVIGLEKFTSSPLVARTALNVFYNTLKNIDGDFYDDISNAGAFSFYYLAVRRSSEIERRIGQTFAMLCSKDGDPIYQELGEALYCRFLASVREQIGEYKLLRENT